MNQAAHLILEAEGVINPIVLHRTSLESYEVVDGDFEYYAAARAREIDPRKGEMIGAFIVEPENEEVIKEQVKVIRKQGSKDDHKPKDENSSQESLKSYTNVEESATEEEMEQLVSFSRLDEGSKIDSLLNQKLRSITAKLDQFISIDPDNFKKSALNEKLIIIENRLEYIGSIIEKLAVQLEKLIPQPKLNLMQAEEEEINSALEEGGANANQRTAALIAIKYWRTSGESLTWQNLEKLTKTGKYKIKNFAKGTYEKLKKIADITS